MSVMHITMVKKRLADGSECRKCQEATNHLQSRGLWNRVDEVVWAQEGDASSAGMALSEKFGVNQAPFFIVRDERGESVYASVLQLARERFGSDVSSAQQAAAIDADDVGGI
jgi:hypothetical protein